MDSHREHESALRTEAQLYEKIGRLEDCLRECANRLEDCVNGEYPGDLRKQYPSIYERKFKRDIAPVIAAREELNRDIEDMDDE